MKGVIFLGESGIAAVCRSLAEPFAEQLGLRLWDVRYVKEGAEWYLRFLVDKDGGVTIDDCEALSRLLSPALDEADPIANSYTLEVMSPGIERELIRPEHFEACLGMPVTVRLYAPRAGVREFTGVLAEYRKDGSVCLRQKNGETAVFAKKEIASAHLTDTDESIGE